MKSSLFSSLFLIFLVSLALCKEKEVYDPMKVNVTPLSKSNWELQVGKQRTNHINVIHFYKPTDVNSQTFAASFGEVSNDMKGLLRFHGVNCVTAPDLCEKEKVKETPLVRVYPPLPIPSYDIQGIDADARKIANEATRYIKSNVIDINATNFDAFIAGSPSVPKVLLFTEKKGVPALYKALSMSFENRLFFGIIRKEDEDLVNKYKIKEFPKLIVVKTTEKKPQIYSGEMKFQAIFDFLNIFSEQYVAGGGSSMDSEATKAWLTELVPEMHSKSAQDICLKTSGTLCVILLSNGEPSKELIGEIKKVAPNFSKKLDRGSEYKYMWLNMETETAWKEIFAPETLPGLVVLNPGSRKRFMALEGEVTQESLSDLLNKINGGDGRFKTITKELPTFTAK